MKKIPFVYFALFICFMLLVSCSSDTSKKNTEPEEEKVEETEQENIVKEENKTEDEEANKEKVSYDDEKNENKPEQGDYKIYLGGEMTEQDNKIIIEGESNLIPGSRVVGQVLVSKNVRSFVNKSTEDYEYEADTTEIVDEEGNFHMEIDHHGTDKETVVAVKFDFDGQQNDDVIRHYGDRGKNLEGPFIYKHQNEFGARDNLLKKAEVSVIFEPEKEQAIRQFKEPDWSDLPEDIGDPLVWIEVEEINDDSEYFYVHGRSNLIEGSRLVIRRNQMNEAETLVLPDGSFNFKFDYEYKEMPFMIQFHPFTLQWNTIEEAYGKRGQKLVGDLVERNPHNEIQHLEYNIEHESQAIDVPDNVELNIEGSEVTMLVPDSVLFDYDKYDLKKDAKDTLSEITKTLESSFNKKELEIVINGHTDDSGTEDYNDKLSKERADEVKKYFDSKLADGFENTIKTKGYGDTKPIASNDTKNGQAKNRRVEIMISLK